MVGIGNLIRELPEGYEEACFSTKAIVRKREISNPSDLMMLCMFHLLNGCSLLEISEIARMTRIGTINDVGFMKRFTNCGKWFEWINERIRPEAVINYQIPEKLREYRIIAVDASDVQEKGRSKRIYRLHYALDIFRTNTVQFRITTNEVGEKLSNYTFQKNDLVLADRGYSSVGGMEYCMQSGASFIARVRASGTAIYNESGDKMDILSMMQQNPTGGELAGYIRGMAHKLKPIRICYRQKTAEQIDSSNKRLKETARRKQKNLQERTMSFNEFIVLITNLPSELCSEMILSLYRLRWQVEILFKRLKSILDYGELPKKTPESSLTWLNGKIMIALLLEKIMSDAFSPLEESSREEFMA